jgi:hypothetical protein
MSHAKKWFIDKFSDSTELLYWIYEDHVREKYELEYPDYKVIGTNGKLFLGEQEVEIDLGNKIITYYSTHGTYRAKIDGKKRDIIRLNREILDCSQKEGFQIRIINTKNQERYLLDYYDINEVRSRRPSRRGNYSLYPVYISPSLQENGKKIAKRDDTGLNGDLTKY